MKTSLSGVKNMIRRARRPAQDPSAPLLDVRNVSKSFGVLPVLKRVNFSVPGGSIVVIIGPNGAGKSTLLKLTSGLLPLDAGEIRFKGRKLNGLEPHQIAALGITQLFQDIQLFLNMSVIDNVLVGCHLSSRADFVSYGLKLGWAKADETRMRERALSKLSMVGLANRAHSNPASLSWGQQKLVGLARALATGSDLLLLDEPYGGLLGEEIERLNQLILGLRRQGMTLVIIEHLTDILMGVADQVVVLDHGEKIAEGTPAEIKSNQLVIDAYLGDKQQ